MAEGKYRAIFEAASAGGENDGDMYLQEPGVEGVFVLFGGSSLDASVLSIRAAYEKLEWNEKKSLSLSDFETLCDLLFSDEARVDAEQVARDATHGKDPCPMSAGSTTEGTGLSTESGGGEALAAGSSKSKFAGCTQEAFVSRVR